MQIRASREVDSASPVFIPSAFGTLGIGGTGQEELGFWSLLRAGASGKGTVWYCRVLLSKHSSTKGVFECQACLWVSLTVSNSTYPANSLRKEFYLTWKVMSALLSY